MAPTTTANLRPGVADHGHRGAIDDAVPCAQQRYSATHGWFCGTRPNARSQFPKFEVPDAIAARVESFLARQS